MGLNHAIILEMPTEASLPADSAVVIAALSPFFFFQEYQCCKRVCTINNMTFNCWAITDESKTNKALVVHL